jgi:uncharacterized protein (TIGR00369 family)
MATAVTRDMSAVLNAHRSGWDAAMGIRFVEATTERVVAEYTIGPEHRQPYGIVHGGVHTGLVETVCSIGAGLVASARGQGVVGLENHTSFIHAVREGRVRVTAVPLTRGRRVQVWEARAEDESGRLVSTGRVRLLCLEPGTDLAGKPVEPGGGE